MFIRLSDDSPVFLIPFDGMEVSALISIYYAGQRDGISWFWLNLSSDRTWNTKISFFKISWSSNIFQRTENIVYWCTFAGWNENVIWEAFETACCFVWGKIDPLFAIIFAWKSFTSVTAPASTKLPLYSVTLKGTVSKFKGNSEPSLGNPIIYREFFLGLSKPI